MSPRIHVRSHSARRGARDDRRKLAAGPAAFGLCRQFVDVRVAGGVADSDLLYWSKMEEEIGVEPGGLSGLGEGSFNGPSVAELHSKPWAFECLLKPSVHRGGEAGQELARPGGQPDDDEAGRRKAHPGQRIAAPGERGPRWRSAKSLAHPASPYNTVSQEARRSARRPVAGARSRPKKYWASLSVNGASPWDALPTAQRTPGGLNDGRRKGVAGAAAGRAPPRAGSPTHPQTRRRGRGLCADPSLPPGAGRPRAGSTRSAGPPLFVRRSIRVEHRPRCSNRPGCSRGRGSGWLASLAVRIVGGQRAAMSPRAEYSM